MLPKEKRTFSLHLTAIKKKREITPNIAGKIVMSILWLWQTSSYPKLQPVASHGLKKYINDSEVQQLAIWIAERSFLEATFWLSSAYALLVGAEYQNKHAMYFTPPLLADRLIDNLVSQGASLTQHVWKDPACGGGAFLTPVAARMADKLQKEGIPHKEIIQTIARNLVGSDIDSVLTTLSRNFVYMAMYEPICHANHIPNLNITRADSLVGRKASGSKIDVLICNPPYRKMARNEVDTYREEFNDVIEGQPNLYGLFMRKCLSLAGPNALIGLLTPTSYLSGQHFSRLRKRLTELSEVRQLDLIRQREGVFLGVEQETVLSIFKERPHDARSTSSATVFVFEDEEFKDIGSFAPPSNGAAWAIPRNFGDASILKTAGMSPYRLSDYGYAARTGAYVYYRDRRPTFDARPEPSLINTVFPLIWSSDIMTNGDLIHGRANKQEKRDTYIDMEDPNHTSVIRNPCVALQRITSPDQSRRLVGAAVPAEILQQSGGIVGENHVLFLEQMTDNPMVTPPQLAAILGSEIVDRLFRCMSGAVNVSIFELNQLSLPAPKQIRSLLVDAGLSVDEAVQLAFTQTRG